MRRNTVADVYKRQSLLAAAAASGVRARVLSDTRTVEPGPGALTGADIPARRLATLALLLVFQLALTEALFPNFVSRHLIIPCLLYTSGLRGRLCG